MVDSSLETEVVVLVVVEWMSLDFLDVFPFLFPMTEKAVILSTSKYALMCRLNVCWGWL